MFSLTYNSLTEIRNVSTSTSLSGSSKFIMKGNKLIDKKTYKNFKEIDGTVNDNYLKAIKSCDLWNIPYSPEILQDMGGYGIQKAQDIIQYRNMSDLYRTKIKKHKSTYKLNKSKVKKKLTALCRLQESRKFIAFYSISFPSQAPDKILYKIFNKWLTSCRTRYNLKTYAWVAERQGNGTLHFHLLTPNWLDVKAINRSMANSISTEVKNGTLSWGNSSKYKYNGIDVDSPQYPKKRQTENRESFRKRKAAARKGNLRNRLKWIASYLVKYVTKCDEEFTHLAYHSSRDVSALFTSQLFNDNNVDFLLSNLSDNADDYVILSNDLTTTYISKIDIPDELYKYIDNINEEIYKKIHSTYT